MDRDASRCQIYTSLLEKVVSAFLASKCEKAALLQPDWKATASEIEKKLHAHLTANEYTSLKFGDGNLELKTIISLFKKDISVQALVQLKKTRWVHKKELK